MKKFKKMKQGFTVVAATGVAALALLGYNGGLGTVFGESVPLIGDSSSPTSPLIGDSSSPTSPTGGGSGTVVSPTQGSGSSTDSTPKNIVTQTIAPGASASLATKDGAVSIALPAGVFGDASRSLTVGTLAATGLQLPTPQGVQLAGTIVDIQVDGQAHTMLEKPVTITLQINKTAVAGVDPRRIAVFYEDTVTGAWIYQGANVDMGNGVIQFQTNHFSTYAVLANTQQFTDADQFGWASGSINTALGGKIIDGYQDGTFRPSENVTRAQFVQMLVKAVGLSPASNDSLAFADVVSSDWFYNAVLTAAKAGLVEGVTDTTFDPNATVTREQAATFISRAFALVQSQAGMDAAAFTDFNQTSDWAKTAIETLAQAGVLNGFEDHTERPNGWVTRAQAVQFLVNALGNIGKTTQK